MSFTPYKPYQLLFMGNSSTVTGTTLETTLASVNLKGGALGMNDYIEAVMMFSYSNSVNDKTMRFKIGTSEYFVGLATTSATAVRRVEIFNRNSQASQVSYAPSVFIDNGSTTVAVGTFTEDLSLDKTIAVTGQLESGAETIALESLHIILWKSQL